MDIFFEKILSEKNIAYAIFDDDFILAEHSQNFSGAVHTHSIIGKNTIWEIFPELFGSEHEVISVLKGQAKKYEIEKINKYSATNSLHYYTLTLLPLIEDLNKLLCIISDTSSETSLEQRVLQQKHEIALLRASLSSYGNNFIGGILGDSPQLEEVRKFIEKITNLKNIIILLEGESGTGKNLVARAIHQQSMEPDTPFIEINCASIPPTLLESEIFGHEKGAFTNAISSKKGLLEEADRGTLFLDEIGELPLSLQSKFLSFIETKRFRRIGSTQEKKVQTRIIAATNKDLRQAIENKEFRQDLYYRINVVSLKLPALRELGDDIIAIANNFIVTFSFDFRKKVHGLTEAAKSKLLRYSWPGNVRELRNAIERAIIFAEGEMLDANEIILTGDEFRHQAASPVNLPDTGISMAQIEKKLLIDALDKTGGNQSRAAKLLDLTLDTFRYRIKKHNISV